METHEPSRHPLKGARLGLILGIAPEDPRFRHGIRLAEAAVRRGAQVYLYLTDLAVKGLDDPALRRLKDNGLNLFACAYSARKHGTPMDDSATFTGLTVVNDLIVNTDRSLCFM